MTTIEELARFVLTFWERELPGVRLDHFLTRLADEVETQRLMKESKNGRD